jgi:hypothetical protein
VKVMLPIQPHGCRRRSSERSRWLWAAARTHRGLSWRQYAISYVPKLKLEIAVEDERVEDVVEAIQKAARSCKIGEGKIFVLDLEAAPRIRHRRNRPASGTGAGFPALSSCGKAKIVGVP